MKINYILLLIFISVIIYAGVDFETGITETTHLNGQGCVCHNIIPDTSVHVWIEGPDTLLKGETAEYHIFLTGGPMVEGGFNVASRFSTLSAIDPGTQVLNGELTHNQPRIFTGDTVSWYFNYTAADSVDWDTLYSDANSVNGDGIPSELDHWDFGANFPVRLLDIVPVELVSLNAVNSNDGIILKWTTATETNNRGFEIQKKNIFGIKETGWEKIGFINGYGTTVQEHSYSYSDKKLAAGKYQYRLKQIDFNGSFEYSQVVNAEINISNDFLLSQNYPNPFNPTTTISFVIGSSSYVTLKIYDVLGKEVATLVNENKNPGEYAVKFNASNLASGIYIYTMTVRNFSVAKKLLLLK